MENLFISNLNEKGVSEFTTDFGASLRKDSDKPFKKVCNTFTNANIIRLNQDYSLTDEEYFSTLDSKYINPLQYDLKRGKNNIILERYPKLESNESYIFVCNHTCPEDIETVLNIIDRNAYLVLGSIDTLKHNPEAYLLWANGFIPFDILSEEERALLVPKMNRVLSLGNSVLIFPEGSHNNNPYNLINDLFDGPVNSSMDTGKKIVPITLMRDDELSTTYIDVGNPIDLKKLDINPLDYYKQELVSEDEEKYYVKSISSYIRNRMATSVYYMMMRHFKPIIRSDYDDISKYFRNKFVENAFKKLHWGDHNVEQYLKSEDPLEWEYDVFKAEYLVKTTKERREYEEVMFDLARIQRQMIESENLDRYIEVRKGIIDYQALEQNIKDNVVADNMRNYWIKNYYNKQNKKLERKK